MTKQELDGLINAFRGIVAKNAITPASLAVLLQSIADTCYGSGSTSGSLPGNIELSGAPSANGYDIILKVDGKQIAAATIPDASTVNRGVMTSTQGLTLSKLNTIDISVQKGSTGEYYVSLYHKDGTQGTVKTIPLATNIESGIMSAEYAGAIDRLVKQEFGLRILPFDGIANTGLTKPESGVYYDTMQHTFLSFGTTDFYGFNSQLYNGPGSSTLTLFKKGTEFYTHETTDRPVPVFTTAKETAEIREGINNITTEIGSIKALQTLYGQILPFNGFISADSPDPGSKIDEPERIAWNTKARCFVGVDNLRPTPGTYAVFPNSERYIALISPLEATRTQLYIDRDDNTLYRYDSENRQLVPVSHGVKVVLASQDTIEAEPGTYYCFFEPCDKITVNLPSMRAGDCYSDPISVYLEIGESGSLSIESPEGGNTIEYFSGYSIEPGKKYEINILWNGTKWVVAYGTIE